MSEHAPFEMLLSAEMLVDDASATLEVLIERLGIDRPRDAWRQLFPGYGFEAYWCRVGRDIGASPTRLEIISPHGEPDPALCHPHMREIFLAQRDRPAKAHSTPITVADVAVVAAGVAARGARHRLDPPIDELPFLRLWMGFTADEPTTYRPDSDAGLRLEFIPTAGLGLPAAAAEPRPPAGAVERRHDGSFVGIAARLFTTDDLAATTATLAHTFDWSPAEIVDDGTQRARYRFAYERSAVLEIVQPAPGSTEHEHLKRWGSGPYGIRLTVDGLDAKADDLRARGTGFIVVERADARVILVDPVATAGTHFELVDVAQRI
jgi:hypothetical protein